MQEHRYFEIIAKELTEFERLEQLPQLVRIEVEGLAEAELLAKKYADDFKDITHKVQYHQHFHSPSGKSQPCVVTELA